MTATCETCRFWVRETAYNEKGVAWGECHAHPPVITISGAERTPISEWPTSPSNKGCGEHQPRAEEAPAARSVEAWTWWRRVLEDCVDSLEYVNRHFPETGGAAVREERILRARTLLTLAEHDEEPQP